MPKRRTKLELEAYTEVLLSDISKLNQKLQHKDELDKAQAKSADTTLVDALAAVVHVITDLRILFEKGAFRA